MFTAGRAQVAHELRNVFVCDGANGFEFDDQLVFYKQIGEVVAEYRAVFIENRERMLLDDLKTLFAKPMSEAVLVDFLCMAVAMVLMKREAGFADAIAELEDRIFNHVFLRRLSLFAANGAAQSVVTTLSGWPPEQR